MRKPIFFVFLLILVPICLNAQVAPHERSILNYRIVGFSFPADQNADKYILEIAAGYYNSIDSFRKKIIRSLPLKTNKTIAEVPSFGSQYTWRIVSVSAKSSKITSGLYHFSVGTIPEVDDAVMRLRVMQQALKYKDAFIFMDCSKVLYDMRGRPVWYLPPIEGKTIIPKDLKLSPKGTITFLTTETAEAYEINYNGDVLWKAPDNGKVGGKNGERYHHEFTRMQNGNYLILGTELLNGKTSLGADNSFQVVFDSNTNQVIPFGTIIEYDNSGNVVWSWRSSEYYGTSDLIHYKPQAGTILFDVHENSFYLDEKDKVIYLSCRGISRIIKIKYPEGTVLNNFGEIYRLTTPTSGNGLFCAQHSVSRTGSGSLLLFNNNSCNTGERPKIQIFLEPAPGISTLKVKWEYECIVEDDAPRTFQAGGSAASLSGGEVFACMGNLYSKTFIVNANKEIMWSALPEKWNETEKKWLPFGLYKASIIENRQSLENLIFGTK